MVTVVHIPMDVARHQSDIKEVIKGRGEMDRMMEISEVPLKGCSVGIDRLLPLAKMCWSFWDERSCRPGLKSKKIVLECKGPLSKG